MTVDVVLRTDGDDAPIACSKRRRHGHRVIERDDAAVEHQIGPRALDSHPVEPGGADRREQHECGEQDADGPHNTRPGHALLLDRGPGQLSDRPERRLRCVEAEEEILV